ncbi:MAG: LysE family translocator [Pseudomonadota bacterium]
MDIQHLIAFNIALFAAIATPGPALMVAVRTTLNTGRISGIAIGAGLGTMAATWTLMALLGMDAVFDMFPWAYATAKTLGAAYLLFIAYKTWTNARSKVDTQVLPAGHAFRQGFLINLLNPKSVLFAAAVLIVVFPAEMSAVDNALVVLNHLAMELLFYTALAFGMSSSAVSERYLKAKIYFDRTASVVLGALGLRLLVSR